jgi:hypothetical protein
LADFRGFAERADDRYDVEEVPDRIDRLSAPDARAALDIVKGGEESIDRRRIDGIFDYRVAISVDEVDDGFDFVGGGRDR